MTFWDDVTNASRLFKVSTGSSATFFGTFGGLGITGGGQVIFEADVTPGFSPAAVTFGGNIVFDPASTLHIDIGGTTPGNGPNNHDQVNVVGTATIDGALNLVPYNGFVPVSGDKFVVMTYAAETGTFSPVTGTSQRRFDLHAVYQPTSLVILTTTTARKPGESIPAATLRTARIGSAASPRAASAIRPRSRRSSRLRAP